MYRVTLYTRDGTFETSKVEPNLNDAARTTVELANYALECRPDLLSDDGTAEVKVCGISGRELSDDEKARLHAMLTEHGALTASPNDDAEVWELL